MKYISNDLEALEDKCECKNEKSIPFLDTSLTIKKGKISVDLYKKPTDQNQYLLTNSVHPPDCIKNIPYSLELRITRICTEQEDREHRYKELKDFLIERKYKPSLIDASIRRARAIPRSQSLKPVAPPLPHRRPVFAVIYDPRLPDLKAMQRKHWRLMTQDSYLKSVFPEPPLVAFRRQRNIADFLIRAKLPPKQGQHKKRRLNGMKKCGKICLICPYINERKRVEGNNFSWFINNNMNCKSHKNIIYMIECNKPTCKQRYIGETERNLFDRICEHIGYIRTEKHEKATGHHFNLPGHSLANMTATILEKVKVNDPEYRKEREKYHIRKFNTFYSGINLKP